MTASSRFSWEDRGRVWVCDDRVGPKVTTIRMSDWNGLARQRSFPPHGWLICGVRTNVNDYRAPFTKEARPGFPLQTQWWPAYKGVEPPGDRFWEGDNLQEYRNHLVETILEAWKELAPLVDEAVGHRSS